MTCKVVHCKMHKYDVYIGRGSKWGNPFIIGQHGNRQLVILKYKYFISKNPRFLNSLSELYNKTLGCWCCRVPVDCIREDKECHGEVLLELVNKHVQNNAIQDLFCYKCCSIFDQEHPVTKEIFCQNGHSYNSQRELF